MRGLDPFTIITATVMQGEVLKVKKYREHLLLITGGRLFLLSFVVFPLLMLVTIFQIEDMVFESPLQNVLFILFLCLFPIVPFTVLKPIWQRCFGTLVVDQEQIIFTGFLIRAIRMKIKDCKYVGLAAFSDGILDGSVNHTTYNYLNTVHISIYFSVEPCPRKCKNRIDLFHCKKGFIKFRYTDKLCSHIMSVFPKSSTSELAGYYHMRQYMLQKQTYKGKKRSGRR